MVTARPTLGRINGFDGLRAVAITLVFCEHRTGIGPLLGFGGLGVMTFFVLSGYLITSILLQRRRQVEAGVARIGQELSIFFQHRAFRIFPAYFGMIALVWLLDRVTPGTLIENAYIPMYLTYTTNIFIEYQFHSWPLHMISSLWTLAIEEQFYVLSAPLFLLFRISSAKYIVGGLIAAGLLAFVLRGVFSPSEIGIDVDSFLNFGILAIGSAMALTVRPQQGRSSWLVICAPIATVAAVGAYHILHLRLAAPAAAAVNHVGVFSASMIVWNVLKNQQSIVVRMLELAPLRFLGRISYAFYLWHTLIDFDFARPALTAVLHNAHVAAWLLQIAEYGVTVIVATVSWRVIEQPALRLRDRLVRREVVTATAQSPISEHIP